MIGLFCSSREIRCELRSHKRNILVIIARLIAPNLIYSSRGLSNSKITKLEKVSDCRLLGTKFCMLSVFTFVVSIFRRTERKHDMR